MLDENLHAIAPLPASAMSQLFRLVAQVNSLFSYTE